MDIPLPMPKQSGYHTIPLRSALYPAGTFQYDNRWVVPHNPYLCWKYKAYINVEVCIIISVKDFKLIFINRFASQFRPLNIFINTFTKGQTEQLYSLKQIRTKLNNIFLQG